VKIVLDTTILVRANERSHGLARELLLNVVESKHTLLLSNEMLHELAREASSIHPSKVTDKFPRSPAKN
jgi:predicted nucleic acid-binding protein